MSRHDGRRSRSPSRTGSEVQRARSRQSASRRPISGRIGYSGGVRIGYTPLLPTGQNLRPLVTQHKHIQDSIILSAPISRCHILPSTIKYGLFYENMPIRRWCTHPKSFIVFSANHGRAINRWFVLVAYSKSYMVPSTVRGVHQLVLLSLSSELAFSWFWIDF